MREEGFNLIDIFLILLISCDNSFFICWDVLVNILFLCLYFKSFSLIFILSIFCIILLCNFLEICFCLFFCVWIEWCNIFCWYIFFCFLIWGVIFCKVNVLIFFCLLIFWYIVVKGLILLFFVFINIWKLECCNCVVFKK